MAGTLEDNAAVYKQLTNKSCPQATPRELIDTTTFTIDFPERKFISIGLESANSFQLTARLVTATRYVNITVEMLRRIFGMMGNILSIISNPPVKSRERLFLKDENLTLSKASYRGDNMLAIESHFSTGVAFC